MAQPKQRNPSSGTIALVEAGNGTIRLVVEFNEDNGTDKSTIDRIRSGIAGMNYLFESDPERVAVIGSAYINGMEEGYKRGLTKGKRDKKGKPYQDSKVGFAGDVV